MKLVNRVDKVIDKSIDALAILAIAIIVFSTLLINADVFGRYFLNNPISNVTETTEHSLFYVTFLGAAWILKKGAHVRIDVVYNMLNPQTQALLNFITSVFGVIVCLVLTWAGGQATWNAFVRGTPFATLWAPPQWPVLVVVPVGSFVLLIQFIRESYMNLGKWRLLRGNIDKATEMASN